MSLEELFDKFEGTDEYLKFERIPEEKRLHPSNRLCGILYLANLMNNPADFGYHAEHDILYLSDEDELKEVTEDDVLYLIRCGFHYEEGVADFC